MTTQQQRALIIGGGPGGATTALHLLQKGIQPVILEPAPFPRYHIGESLTGECGGALRKLGLGPKLAEANYPIKHGVTVWGPNGQNKFFVPVMERRDGELSPQTTYQVRRSDFDKMLLETALDQGAELVQWEAQTPIVEDGEMKGVICKTADGKEGRVLADVTIDASGQSVFLGNRGVIGPVERGAYDKQVAVFSQVRDAIRGDEVARDNTLIFYKSRHHWGWFIPLDDEAVSIGVVVPSSYLKASGLPVDEFLSREVREMNAEMNARIPNLDYLEPVRTISNYSYRIDNFVGKRHLCVGDSHRFIDPIFSFGVNFAVREGSFAANAVADFFEGKSDSNAPFAEYEKLANRGQDMIQDLVDCFWAHPFAFAVFAHQRYRGDIIDLFAGRIYHEMEEPSPGLRAIRSHLANHGRGEDDLPF